MHALTPAFYQREDVVSIARELIGKVLVTQIDGQRTALRITETEAYRAPDDRACHAWGNRRTPRTQVMFEAGGIAYIYLCYGIHHLFNVVTGPPDMAHAVLIRAGEPLFGMEHMLARRNLYSLLPRVSSGPGALSQALGLHTRWNAAPLTDPTGPIYLADDGFLSPPPLVSKRIGVAYAGPCAERPWRFLLPHTRYISQKP